MIIAATVPEYAPDDATPMKRPRRYADREWIRGWGVGVSFVRQLMVSDTGFLSLNIFNCDKLAVRVARSRFENDMRLGKVTNFKRGLVDATLDSFGG